jgi:hypothetical protein
MLKAQELSVPGLSIVPIEKHPSSFVLLGCLAIQAQMLLNYLRAEASNSLFRSVIEGSTDK